MLICSLGGQLPHHWQLKMTNRYHHYDALSAPAALLQTGGISVFKDINILANHLHGFYGSMGTDAAPCDSPLPTDGPCYRGDNIFADIEPGTCAYYQYDHPLVASPGALW